jgi:hypothetical protein
VYGIHRFFLTDEQVGGARGLRLEVMYDDGFVAYLNGVEVARRSMPYGPVTYQTLALGHEGRSPDPC